MAMQKSEHMDKVVRAEMRRLLRDRIKNPMLEAWDWEWEHPDDLPIKTAYMILMKAELLDSEGRITLAGMDYHRKEAQPIRTWLQSNWFAVIVAGCTIGIAVWGIVGG